MEYIFLLIANFAGISKVVAMKCSGKVCSGEYNSVRINTLRSILCGIVSVIMFLIAGAKAQSSGWWIWLISGLSNALMMFLWVICTQKISLIYLETFSIIGSTAIPMIIGPYIYQGESVTLLQWLGVACLLLAVIALSVKPKLKQEVNLPPVKKKENSKLLIVAYVLLLILSYVGVSVSQKLYPTFVGKEYTEFFNLMTFSVVLLCFSMVLVFGKVFKKQSFMPKDSSKSLLIFIVIAAVMIYVYQYFSTLAAGMMPSAVFYPLLKGIAMTLTVVCDVVIFKQRMTINKVVGLIFVFAAIILINI